MDRNTELKQMGMSSRCIPQETSIENVQLAVAYVPFQKLCNVMNPIESLSKGTAFPELYSPYHKREFTNLEPEICSRAEIEEVKHIHD